MKSTDDFKKGWLQGIFDGEGTIFFRGHGKKGYSALHHISMTNTDMAIINRCREYLSHFEIHHVMNPRKKMSKPNWKQTYIVMIYRQEDILKFSEAIGFSSPKKVEKLANAIQWINRPRTKYDIEELKLMHWRDGLSFRGIAKELGLKGRSGIKYLFDRHNIPRRDRLTALKNHYV